MRMTLSSFLALSAIILTGISTHAVAQDRSNLPIPDPAFKGKIGLTPADSVKDFPQAVTPPEGAPNVLIILTDDVGFGASSTFGGPIPTPTMDRIANAGLRFNNFHTTALCSPTRAALLTGRNHHSVATGVIMEAGVGYPGYNTLVPQSKRGLGDILEAQRLQHGLVRQEPQRARLADEPSGPFNLWPVGLGFEYFYGFVGGDTNQWAPALVENTRPIEPPHDDPNYNFDERHGGQSHRLVAHAARHGPQQAVLRLLRAGYRARTASRAEGVDREVQGQVRSRLGQAARADHRQAEGDGHHPAEHAAHRAFGGHRGVGLAQRRREEGLRPHDGGLRGGSRALRLSRWAASSTPSRRWASSTTRSSSTSRATMAPRPRAAVRVSSTR